MNNPEGDGCGEIIAESLLSDNQLTIDVSASFLLFILPCLFFVFFIKLYLGLDSFALLVGPDK